MLVDEMAPRYASLSLFDDQVKFNLLPMGIYAKTHLSHAIVLTSCVDVLYEGIRSNKDFVVHICRLQFRTTRCLSFIRSIRL